MPDRCTSVSWIPKARSCCTETCLVALTSFSRPSPLTEKMSRWPWSASLPGTGSPIYVARTNPLTNWVLGQLWGHQSFPRESNTKRVKELGAKFNSPRRTDWKSARVFTIPVAGASLRFLQLLANKISKAPRQRGRGVIFSLDEHDTASQGLPSKAHGYEPADLDLIGH